MLATSMDTSASRGRFTSDTRSCLVVQDVTYEMPIFLLTACAVGDDVIGINKLRERNQWFDSRPIFSLRLFPLGDSL